MTITETTGQSEVRCPTCGHLVLAEVPWLCPSCGCLEHSAPCPCGHASHGDAPCPRPACGCRTSVREVAA